MRLWRLSRTPLAAAALALAAGVSAETPPGGEIKEHSAKGGFEYVTGGVGEKEQAIMESRYHDYALKLVNVRSGPEAAYIANVDITMSNHQGETVLQATTKGPWLIADAPPGQYEVQASFDGNTQTKTVVVPADSNQRRVFDWNTGQ